MSVKTEVIDELNRRMEDADDNGDIERHEALNDFYQWFVERYIY